MASVKTMLDKVRQWLCREDPVVLTLSIICLTMIVVAAALVGVKKLFSILMFGMVVASVYVFIVWRLSKAIKHLQENHCR